MKIGITKPVEVDAKILKMHLKVCDNFTASLCDQNGDENGNNGDQKRGSQTTSPERQGSEDHSSCERRPYMRLARHSLLPFRHSQLESYIGQQDYDQRTTQEQPFFVA